MYRSKVLTLGLRSLRTSNRLPQQINTIPRCFSSSPRSNSTDGQKDLSFTPEVHTLQQEFDLSSTEIADSLRHFDKNSFHHNGSLVKLGHNYLEFVLFKKASVVRDSSLDPLSIDDLATHSCSDDLLANVALILKLHNNDAWPAHKRKGNNKIKLANLTRAFIGALQSLKGDEVANKFIEKYILCHTDYLEPSADASKVDTVLKTIRPALILNYIMTSKGEDEPFGDLFQNYRPDGSTESCRVVIKSGNRVLGEAKEHTVKETAALAAQNVLYEHYNKELDDCPIPAELEFLPEYEALPLTLKSKKVIPPLISMEPKIEKEIDPNEEWKTV